MSYTCFTLSRTQIILTSAYNTLTFRVRFRVSNRVRVRVRVRFRVRDRVRVSVQRYIVAVIQQEKTLHCRSYVIGRYDFPDGLRIAACVNTLALGWLSTIPDS